MHMQITGGHKYLPPRQDVNAPDLYIPFMAVCTYCLLASISKLAHGSFTPDSMYALVSLPALPFPCRAHQRCLLCSSCGACCA